MKRSRQICALALHKNKDTKKILDKSESPPPNIPENVEKMLSEIIDVACQEEELEQTLSKRHNDLCLDAPGPSRMDEECAYQKNEEVDLGKDDSEFDTDEDYVSSVKKIRSQRISDYFGVTQNTSKLSGMSREEKHLIDSDSNNNDMPSNSDSSVSHITNENNSFENLVQKYAYLDGKFFKILEVTKNRNLKTQCILCLPRYHIIKGILSVSTNFIKHIQKVHPPSLKNYKDHLFTNKSRHSKDRPQNIESHNKKSAATMRQPNISSSLKCCKFVGQDEFETRIIKFIVNSMSPLNILDNKYFIDIFRGSNLSVITRKKAVQKISDLNKQKLQSIKNKLEQVEFVCTTTDFWSSKKRSFLGVTCHWLDQNLERISVALACKRFSGPHTYDKIAEQLDEVYTKFSLTNKKIIATTTDNGSNFVKAFQEFGLKLNFNTEISRDQWDMNEDELSHDSDNSSVDDKINDDEENLPTFIEIEHMDELNNSPESPNQVRLELPNHKRCASHTLNLIAVNDVKRAIESSTLWRTRHTAVLNKCSILWKKFSFPKSAEIIKDCLGQYLSYPGTTRWNSLFDSIQQILRHSDKLNDLLTKLDTKILFREAEIQYLQNYSQILAPVASALDILQGEKNCYYGYLLPCLISLKVKLIKIQKSDQINTEPAKSILNACIKGLDKRFEAFLIARHDIDDAILATFSIPQFKLRWYGAIANEATRDLDTIKKMITFAMAKMVKVQETKSNETNISSNFLDKFFDFDPQGLTTHETQQQSNPQLSQSSLQEIDVSSLEILRYLEDQRTDLTVLNEFPTIRKLFLKYNTPLPSSAPVERMFSFASIINAPRRHALSDNNFEYLVLLKANGDF